jgi:hypothetical protein
VSLTLAPRPAEEEYGEEDHARQVVRSAVEQKHEKGNREQTKADSEIEKGERGPFSRT